ncbi:MAG TPA: putative porin [Candidatus Prevotella stercoripullorum]|nr:putative porin [Candidatus Prevotella stercoripullorum]
MKARLIFALSVLLVLSCLPAGAQGFNQLTDQGEFTNSSESRNSRRDSLSQGHKEIPKGLKVWTVDERFGERIAAEPDTLPHMYMNSIFTEGLRGEYNTLGNLGSPRINRIFIDRGEQQQFMFTQPYDYFITPVDKFHFTNTLSPITNLSYNTCGNRTNGEDHFKALFGVNVGKRLGVGFKFDYLYGRGYFQNQSTSHFNYSMYGSYLGERYQAHLLFSTNHEKVTENGGITDDQYITHPESFEDNFRNDEIPTVLQENWNRNDNQHIFFSHRYSFGFSRKVKMTEDEIKAKKFAMASMKENAARKAKEEARKKAEEEGREFDEDEFDEQKTFSGRPDDAVIAGNEPADTVKTSGGRISVDKAAADSLLAADAQQSAEMQGDTTWMKDEYVPVTSFIHTLKFDNYERIYQAYDTPEGYYANTYPVHEKLPGDSIYDRTTHYSLKNTFAVALLEGFNKWAKAGLRAFVTSDLRHFTLPDSVGGRMSYNEHNLSVGGQLLKAQGKTLHYNVTGEFWLMGEDAGQLKIDGRADLNFRLFKDTVTLAANAFFHRLNPTFYYRHYHSRHLWWDNGGLDQELRTHIEGLFSLKRTKTKLRVAYDNLQNYTYFAQRYNITEDFGRSGNTVSVRQSGKNISLLTLQLAQDFRLGPLNWQNVITYQKSSDEDVLPVPMLNVYTNLFLHFKIAKVLTVDLGADARFFTKYKALDYSPALGQFTVQDNGAANVETGNYPIVNAYANMHLKHTRFFVMMSHVNASSGDSFLVPHYPVNGRIFRFGVSWNFFN